MVELRKRPPPKEPAAPPPAAKRGSGAGAKVKQLANKAKEAIAPSSSATDANNDASASAPAAPETGSSTAVVPETTLGATALPGATAAPTTALPVDAVPANGADATQGQSTGGKGGKISGAGGKVDLSSDFGGKISTHDGNETTFKELLEKSQAGVVIFTYPKASTPGCTTQACLFRDSYTPITGASLAVYGLSTDSPKSNTTFATRQSLPFPLLCDPNATLTTAIGMKKPGPGKSTSRGVVIIDKQGNVKVWEQAGPQKTLDVVLEYIKSSGTTTQAGAAPQSANSVEVANAAKLAAPYIIDADTKMLEVPLIRTPSKSEEREAATAAEVSDVAATLDKTPQVGTPVNT